MSDLATKLFAAGARRGFLAGATALACLVPLAWTAPAQTNVPQVRLQVVDVESGQPVPGVKVRAWVHAEPTDPSGVRMIPLPKPGSENFSYRITLSKDGTFSYHFVFPDGQFHIPISATSADGVETRSALLSFLRMTELEGDVRKTAQPVLDEPIGRK